MNPSNSKTQGLAEELEARGCIGKVSHPNKNSAIIAMKRTGMQNKYLSVYRCEFCDQWHVGKNSKHKKSFKRVMRRDKARSRRY